ncbi:hypothetical protein BDW74DRAFT_149447 [Aspergillus multicolor]|uniref:uncharacterized protein n=1 Tax=Aspergillus multicolor TaxID=41759 RepID=UPI003CCDC985
MTADEPNASQDTVHNTTPASESFSSQPYFAHPASVPQPSSPSPQFPALLDSLSSGLRPYPPGLEAPTRQAQYFEIYEDPEDMDIDGVGYFDLDSVLCMSPDEDKENEHAGEQGSQGQIQNQTQAQTQNRESNPDQGQQDQG